MARGMVGRRGTGDTKKGWNEKNLIENGPGVVAHLSGLPANEKTFQLSMFFLHRVFSRCNKLNVTHIPGARFSITLCFPPVSTVRRLLSRARAGTSGRLHFHSSSALRCATLRYAMLRYALLFLTLSLSSSLAKKFFSTAAREILRRDAPSVMGGLADSAAMVPLRAENIFRGFDRVK